jgi:cell division septation protein DedD
MPKYRVILIYASAGMCLLLLYSAGIVTGMMLRPRPQIVPPAITALRTKPKPVPQAHAIQQLTTRPGVIHGPGQAGPAQLAVQVAVFKDPIRAQSLSDSLKRQGFSTIPINQTKDGQENQYTVLLGPYPDWDTASRVAADVQRSYNVQTYVHPL